jgi:hypothetical protein
MDIQDEIDSDMGANKLAACSLEQERDRYLAWGLFEPEFRSHLVQRAHLQDKFALCLALCARLQYDLDAHYPSNG